MARYAVTTVVEYYGVVEADSQEEAEALGWQWEGGDLHYSGVESIEVEELESDEDEDED
jgi:hypothetical protein